MGKRSRRSRPTASSGAEVAQGAVGPRQPCPCGSGKRYKACHGDPRGTTPAYVARPFAGLPGEADLVAMRELVPAATAPLPLADDLPERAGRAGAGDSGSGDARAVQLVTLLPGAAPAMVRQDGSVQLALQVQHSYGDPSRDLAAVLLRALEAEPGSEVGLPEPPGEGPRLQDLLVLEPLRVAVHEGFGFWVEDGERSPETEAALEQTEGKVHPTARLASVTGAYWTDVGTKEHLRWVMTEPEDALLDALARLYVADRTELVPGARLVGMFRAHGLLTPVWDLPLGTGPEALEDPASDFREALDEALADDTPLTSEERSARAGLANRQVTIR